MDIYGHIRLYVVLHIYIYRERERERDLAVIIFVPSGRVIEATHLQMLEFPAPTCLCVTHFLDLVLWKCSYGPWDYFMCSAKNWSRPAL